MASPLQAPEIDFLILADRAEGVNGKLYMMGGGWSNIRVLDFNQPSHFALAIGVMVPWVATNEDHHVSVFIEHEDGRKLEPSAVAAINVGRPPGAIRGQSFRAILAINGAWKFPGPGSYCAVASLEGGATKRAPFHVMAAQALIQASPPSPSQ
jgi:hypothetical protein